MMVESPIMVYFKYGSIATSMAKNGVFNILICFLY